MTAEYLGTCRDMGETCRHCDGDAAVHVEFGAVAFGLCVEHAPQDMLEGRR